MEEIGKPTSLSQWILQLLLKAVSKGVLKEFQPQNTLCWESKANHLENERCMSSAKDLITYSIKLNMGTASRSQTLTCRGG